MPSNCATGVVTICYIKIVRYLSVKVTKKQKKTDKNKKNDIQKTLKYQRLQKIQQFFNGATNAKVAGSNPAWRAKAKPLKFDFEGFLFVQKMLKMQLKIYLGRY